MGKACTLGEYPLSRLRANQRLEAEEKQRGHRKTAGEISPLLHKQSGAIHTEERVLGQIWLTARKLTRLYGFYRAAPQNVANISIELKEPSQRSEVWSFFFNPPIMFGVNLTLFNV